MLHFGAVPVGSFSFLHVDAFFRIVFFVALPHCVPVVGVGF